MFFNFFWHSYRNQLLHAVLVPDAQARLQKKPNLGQQPYLWRLVMPKRCSQQSKKPHREYERNNQKQTNCRQLKCNKAHHTDNRSINKLPKRQRTQQFVFWLYILNYFIRSHIKKYTAYSLWQTDKNQAYLEPDKISLLSEKEGQPLFNCFLYCMVTKATIYYKKTAKKSRTAASFSLFNRENLSGS